MLGIAKKYIPLQVTDLHMDADYDCKRVTAPTRLSKELVGAFERMAMDIARGVNLYGVMDVEVILQGGSLKLLEIDARLPSQTPTVVLWSTGFNILEALGQMALSNRVAVPNLAQPQGLVYEHIKVQSGILETAGEHIMRGTAHLRLVRDFFGADEALTDFDAGRGAWVATLIINGGSLPEAWAKRQTVIDKIVREFSLARVVDATPGELDKVVS